VAEQMCVLDNSLGFSVSRLVLTKFQLLHAAQQQEAEVVVESEPEPEPEFVPAQPLSLMAAHAMGSNGEVWRYVRRRITFAKVSANLSLSPVTCTCISLSLSTIAAETVYLRKSTFRISA